MMRANSLRNAGHAATTRWAKSQPFALHMEAGGDDPAGRGFANASGPSVDLGGMFNAPSNQMGSGYTAPAAAAPPTLRSAGDDALTSRKMSYASFARAGQPAITPLVFADGGMFGSLTPNFMKSSAQRYAESQARPAAVAPAMAASAAAPTLRSALDPANALRAREAAAGLQDGGGVPGTGKGDKVPALYEPGEFVVSNAMLDRKPGLRGALHDLRSDTLRSQGRSVAEANAGAMGASLRASSGFSVPPPGPFRQPLVPSGLAAYSPSDEQSQNPTPQGVATAGPAASGADTSAGGLRPAGGASGSDGSLRDAFLNPVTGVFPGTRAVGRGYAADVQQALKEPLVSARVGQIMGATARAVPASLLGLTEDVAAPVTRMMQPVTTGAVNAAHTAFTGNSAPLLPNAAPPTSQGQASTPAAATPDLGAYTQNTPGDQTMGPAPDVNSIRAERQPNGTMSFSGGPNITGTPTMIGPGADSLRSAGTVSTVPGMDPALIRQTLTNPNGSTWSPADNAIMAANLRDGVNPYQGTSRAAGDNAAAANASLRNLALAPAGTSGRKEAQAIIANDQNTETMRRGQDITSADNRYGHELSAEISRNRMRYDMSKDQRDFGAGRADKGFDQSQAADKAWTDHTNTIFSTKDDKGNDVVDTQKAAAYTSAVDQTMAPLAALYAKSADPATRARSALIAKQGRSALTSTERGEMQQLFAKQQLHAADTNTLNPLRSSGPISQNLLDYADVGPENTLFQDRRKLAGGQTIPTTTLRYGADANHIAPNLGQGSSYLLPR